MFRTLTSAWLVMASCTRSPPAPQATSSSQPSVSPATSARQEPLPSASAVPAPESIGSATMEKDGTIVLHLRAEGPGGTIGQGLLRYPKGHAEYDSVLRHVGGLEPGQSKPVPPWPDP